MNLSPHLTYHEAVHSQAADRLGLTNVPGPAELAALHLVAERCFEPARTHFGVPIAVTSGYRAALLNAAIGGSPTSAHCRGEALDLDADVCGGLSNADLFAWLRHHVAYDQLIAELPDARGQPRWVHVSYRAGGNRGEVLRATRTGHGRIVYAPYEG